MFRRRSLQRTAVAGISTRRPCSLRARSEQTALSPRSKVLGHVKPSSMACRCECRSGVSLVSPWDHGRELRAMNPTTVHCYVDMNFLFTDVDLDRTNPRNTVWYSSMHSTSTTALEPPIIVASSAQARPGLILGVCACCLTNPTFHPRRLRLQSSPFVTTDRTSHHPVTASR